MRSARIAALVLPLVSLPTLLPAQQAHWVEYANVMRAPSAVHTPGPGGFGEEVNLYTGEAGFSVVDVSIPGNGDNPVQVARRLRLENRYDAGVVLAPHARPRNEAFGDWELDIPRIEAVVSQSQGWVVVGSSPAQRCSSFGPPPTVNVGSTPFSSTEYWHGYELLMPGQAAVQVVDQRSSPTSNPVLRVPGWGRLSCLSSVTSGGGGAGGLSGQGFVLETPDGLIYEFGHIWSTSYSSMTRPAGTVIESLPDKVSDSELSDDKPVGDFTTLASATLPRARVILAVTRITDRSGNITTYSYTGNRLTSISSTDNRSVTLNWGTNNRINSINAGGRTWSYIYQLVGASAPSGTLSSVSVPGLGTWQYDLDDLSWFTHQYPTQGTSCLVGGALSQARPTGTITHPSGLRAQYTFEMRRHARQGGSSFNSCFGVPGGQFAQAQPVFWDTFSMVEKRLTDGSSFIGTWGIQYQSCTSNCGIEKWTKVTGPVKSPKFVFGNRASSGSTSYGDEGSLLRIEDDEQTTFSYTNRNVYGLSPLRVSGIARGLAAPQETQPLLSQVLYDQTGHSVSYGNFNQHGFPQLVAETGPAKTITKTILYAAFTQRYVLGAIREISMSGRKPLEITYDGNARVESIRRFGLLDVEYTRYADGTAATSKDALNRFTTYSSYHRGVPRGIDVPGPTTISQTVNDFGQITSVTDEGGFLTSYQRDDADRVTRITKGPQVVTIAYSANGRTITETAGALVTTTTRDALWRPTLINEGGARYRRYGYDPDGRLTFESYPSANSTASAGVAMEYDTWSRLTKLTRSSELGDLITSIAYTQNQATVLDGTRASVYQFLSYGFPTYKWPTSVTESGRITTLRRDDWGNVESITRGGFSRTYEYDSHRRLCGHFSPESGGVSMTLDAVGRVSAYSEGVAALSCNGTQITQTFDARDRLLTTNYPGTEHDITRTYHADGALHTIENGSTKWTYTYTPDARRALLTESLQRLGSLPASTQTFVYTVNAQGHRESMAYPSGLTLDYLPNAWGEPTKVGAYASNVLYWANGAIRSFTYGNNATHSTTYNSRWLPQQYNDRSAGVDIFRIDYTYDRFANPRTMADAAVGGMGLRTLGYDDLDRLTSATGAPAWGGNVAFEYDDLDNIRSETRAGQQRAYSYTQNRLTGISNTPISGVTYDDYGRATKWGAQTLTYTPAHRLMTSTVAGDYHSEQDDRFVYDAHGHRVRSESLKGVALQPGGIRVPYVLDQIYAQGEILQLEASGGSTSCRQSNGTTIVENAPQLTNYVYLQGRRIATLSKRPASTTWDCGVTYSHSDATGTPLAFSTDSSPTPTINRISRRPYEHVGNHLTGLPGNLTYMEARYYDRNYGRFLSPDPVLPSMFDGSNFNRYAYANNNPYKYTDPDGRAAGLIGKTFKLLKNGGDVASTIAGAVEDAKTIADSSKPVGTRLLAAASLVTEVISPVSARDAKAGYGAISEATRRSQSKSDKTLPTERAARREAMRQSGAQVSLPNNYTTRDVYGNNQNLRGPNGEPSRVLTTTDTRTGQSVSIDHHNNGHRFSDTNTFEYPHYHGKDGSHISYERLD